MKTIDTLYEWDQEQIEGLLSDAENVLECEFQIEWPDIREYTFENLSAPELIRRLCETVKYLSYREET